MPSDLQPGVIDVHCHVVPGEFPASPSAVETRWPCMVCGAAGRRTVTIEGKPFRELDDRSWDAARRIGDWANSPLGRAHICSRTMHCSCSLLA